MNRSSLPFALPRNFRLQRGWLFGALIIGALVAFEIFNYSTTDYSLSDLLGGLRFLGVRWSTILALAFCGIDFAGIARLFTPEQGADEPAEVWYLFGAWLLAATMNAMLTWWGVSIALVNHAPIGSAFIDRGLMVKIVPVFVAVMVWLIRVLIIGTFSAAGERMFSQGARHSRSSQTAQRSGVSARPTPVSVPAMRPASQPQYRPAPSMRPGISQPQYRAAPKPIPSNQQNTIRSEPTYHPLSMSSGAPSDDLNDRY